MSASDHILIKWWYSIGKISSNYITIKLNAFYLLRVVALIQGRLTDRQGVEEGHQLEEGRRAKLLQQGQIARDT